MQRRTRWRWWGLGIAMLLSLACQVTAATPTPTPISVGVLRDLLIDRSLFPPGWRAKSPPAPLPYEETPAVVLQDLWVQYRPYGNAEGGGGADQAVYRCGDRRAAARAYGKLLPWWFYNAHRVTPYATPDWLTYESTVADRFRFECAEFQGIAYGDYPAVGSMSCVAVGQYGSYVSGFALSAGSPEEMRTMAPLLERLLQAIDERMASVVEE